MGDPWLEQKEYNEGKDEDDADYGYTICDNCSSIITNEEYWRTGVDEYCEECPDICCDPRSKTFGCECEEEEE